MNAVLLTLLALALRVRTRVVGDDRQRGDIPGWVLITVMTAALVTLIWAVLQPQIEDVLDGVLSSVRGPANA